MVYHFSSKLSHLAQSFKPQQHFNSVRNAFPSSAPTVGVSGNAGSRANGWNYQHNRLVAQSPNANTDSTGRVQEEEEDEIIAISNRRITLLPRSTPNHKISLFAKEKLPSILVETGVSNRFVTSQLYGAFRNRTEAEKDVSIGNEMRVERKVISASKVISGTGRRASISRSMISSSPPLPSSPQTIRNYSTSIWTTTTPPSANLPKIRRNSTSSISTRPLPSTIATESKSNYSNPEPTNGRMNGSFGTGHGQFPSAHALQRYEILKSTRQRGDIAAMEGAIRSYQAVHSDYNVITHHLILEILLQIRAPNSPLTKILDLYNQMFDHANLAPSNRTFELIIQAFCKRDKEVLAQIHYLNNRTAKIALTEQARGVWHTASNPEALPQLEIEHREAIQKLEAEDYFTPALKIYKALGSASDLLKIGAVNALLSAAAARGRIDLTLSIFSRLEQSKKDKPNAQTYEILLMMFGKEKDAVGITEVFESYLLARESGVLFISADSKMVGVRNAGKPMINFDRDSVKHRHAASPTYNISTPGKDFFVKGDDSVWRTAIRSYFAAGDSVLAVELVDKITAQTELVPKKGYPTELNHGMFAAMIAGFATVRDFESAKKWWKESLALGNLHGNYYQTLFYATIDCRQSDLVNEIYFAWIEAIKSSANVGKIGIAEFMSIIDFNIANSYSAPSFEARKTAIQTVMELQALKKANPDSIGVTSDFHLSSGVTNRIVQALASHKLYSEAIATYLDGIESLRNDRVFIPTKGFVFRTPEKWISTLTGVSLQAALGQLPTKGFESKSSCTYPDSDRPAFPDVIKATTVTRLLRATIGFQLGKAVAVIVTEGYIAAKAKVGGDVAKLGLDGEGWLTVIEAFTIAAKMTTPVANFPGFDSIMDDFASSGVTLASNTRFDGLVIALRDQGVQDKNIIQILGILESEVLFASREGRFLDEILEGRNPAVVETEEMNLTPNASQDLKKVKSQDPSSVLAETDRPALTLPKPPTTVPAYLLEFGDLPDLSEKFQLNPDLSYKIDQLIQSKAKYLFDVITTSATKGIYAHVDSLARLLEQLGREGDLKAVRELYLMAYGILMKSQDSVDAKATSISWIMLEDHMIIALCTIGQLDQVAIHRDRLLKAGSAPSADGYAAMILNMKETTDDAAVALELFEESQRLNVAPNVYLFNTLISKLSRARRAGDALEYFEYMKSVGLRPSSITYGAIINACCKTGDDSSADYLFEEMIHSPGFKARVPPYNTMIQFYTQTKPNRERALFYYDMLLKAGVKPTGHTYKLLLDAYGSIGDADPVSLQAIFEKIQSDPSITLSGTHWASLINAWGCHSKNLDKAVEIFESISNHPSTLRSKSALPDAVVYESLLNACLANHRGDLCEKYLQDMASRGVRMTAYVVNTLIKGYASQLALPSARTLFESLEDPPAGVAASYNHPTDRTTKAHSSTPISTPSLKDPIYREPSTWETMIRVELASGETGRAQELLTRFEARAFPEPVTKRIRALVIAPSPTSA